VGALGRLLLWGILLPMRIVGTIFKVGRFAACLISLLSVAAIVAIVVLVLFVVRTH
jgi:hypothetical protein